MPWPVNVHSKRHSHIFPVAHLLVARIRTLFRLEELPSDGLSAAFLKPSPDRSERFFPVRAISSYFLLALS